MMEPNNQDSQSQQKQQPQPQPTQSITLQVQQPQHATQPQQTQQLQPQPQQQLQQTPQLQQIQQSQLTQLPQLPQLTQPSQQLQQTIQLRQSPQPQVSQASQQPIQPQVALQQSQSQQSQQPQVSQASQQPQQILLQQVQPHQIQPQSQLLQPQQQSQMMRPQQLFMVLSPAGQRGQFTLQNGQTIMPATIPIQRHQVMTSRAITMQRHPYLAPRAIPAQRHPILTSRATILQQPLIRGVHPTTVLPANQQIGLGIPTSTLGQQPATTIIHPGSIATGFRPTANAVSPSMMTPDDALSKGNSFFQSLILKMAVNYKTIPSLIQSLVDSKITCQEFAIALQKETNSEAQTQLVPFLELYLPPLRQALDSGRTKLPGIRGPNQKDSDITTIPSPASSQQPTTTMQLDDSNAATSSPNKVQFNNNLVTKKKKVPLPPGQKTKYAIRKEQQEAKKRERESLAAAAGIKLEPVTTSSLPTNDPSKLGDKGDKFAKPKSDKPRLKQKKQEKQLESLSSTLRDDDDVNDVAAMGGVNLAEESQRIMASGAELVGTQIRSCRDEPFFDVKVLTNRIARITEKFNLPEPTIDVVTLISHATQERLKDMVERLGILAEHRIENLKLNPKYEVSTDVKGQMKFLAELDRIEKRRYEEQERELLLKVAKSRSKAEDPEQQKLRQKAKDMQRAEQEEVRQREANETALLAIGPRKKMKTSALSSVDSFSQASSIKDVKPITDSQGDTIRKIKRVNMRDLQVLFELDRTHLNRLIKIAAQ